MINIISLVYPLDSNFNNAMKWKPDSYTLVAGTENGYLTYWNLDQLTKSKQTNQSMELSSGTMKVSHQGLISLHEQVF